MHRDNAPGGRLMISAVEELLEQAHRVIVWQLEPLAVVRVVVEVPVARP